MDNISLSKGRLSKVLFDVELLIRDVSLLLNQDDLARKRIEDIEQYPEIGVSEDDLDSYIEKRS